MRHTIYCASMSEMIDLATAFSEGGMAALREAIRHNDKKGNNMSEQQYDNSNRVALWLKDHCEKGTYTGGGKQSEFDGDMIHHAVFTTRDRRGGENAPIGDLVWVTGERGNDTAHYCPIFQGEKGLGGKIDGWWVNVYRNEKGPPLVVKFKAMETAGAASSSESVESDDPLPF